MILAAILAAQSPPPAPRVDFDRVLSAPPLIMDASTATCARWTERNREDGTARVADMAWLTGFVDASPAQNRGSSAISFALILGSMDSACERNSGALVRDTADSVLARLRDPHVIDSFRVNHTEPLSGRDFLLISEAFRHPEIRGRDLSCYHIVIFRQRGTTTVGFLGDREPDREVREGDRSTITYHGPNPRCPSRSFEMNDHGRVVRVIYERH